MKENNILILIFCIVTVINWSCINEVVSMIHDEPRVPLIKLFHSRIHSSTGPFGYIKLISLVQNIPAENRNDVYQTDYNFNGKKAKNEYENVKVASRSPAMIVNMDIDNYIEDYDDLEEKLNKRSIVDDFENMAASYNDKSFPLKEWIFGSTPSTDVVNEANSVSSQLDTEIKDELVADQTLVQGVVNALGFSSTDRERRSPQEHSTSVIDERPLWQQWWYGNTPEMQDVQAANSVSSQMDNVINTELQTDDSTSDIDWLQNFLKMGYKAYMNFGPPDDELKTSAENPVVSSTAMSPYSTPYTLLRYLVPESEYEKVAYDLYDLYTNPQNASYLKTLILFARVVVFFMPGLGIVEQVMFCVAMAKITWKVTAMYNDGRPMEDIAITVLPELAYTLYMYRRDEEFVSQHVLKPGDSVDISGMDARTFIGYTQAMDFPALNPSKEQEIKSDISKLVDDYMKDLTQSKKAFTVDSLMRVAKFVAFVNPKGELKKTFANEWSSEEYAKIFKNSMKTEEKTPII